MNTEADSKVKEARKLVKQALHLMSEVVIGECLGWQDYSSIRKDKLKQSLEKLISTRDQLE